MGTETHYPIGTVLTRREKKDDSLDELRVVGGGKKLIVTSNTEFGQSFEMDSAEVRRDYETDLPDGLYTAGKATYVEAGPSPEEVFAQMARENPVKQKNEGRGRTKATTS